MFGSQTLFFFAPRQSTMNNRYGYLRFQELYPDENSCLTKLLEKRIRPNGRRSRKCPRCAHHKFYRIRSRKCFACGSCGYQVFPLSGTILERTTLPVNLWFFAIFLFANSRNGISSKELSESLGISYKTARRMANKIRMLMSRHRATKLQGTVHIDETLMGGKGGDNRRGWAALNKICLFGMVEEGGRIICHIVNNRKRKTLIPIIRQSIKQGTTIHSDRFRVYRAIPKYGYTHKVRDSKWVTHTNYIEGYWSNLKKSILGTHTWVSPKHLQLYVDEFNFRYNHRKTNLFEKLLTLI